MSDDEGERDFLAEAKQASEMAVAMAQIAALTSSATISLSKLSSSQQSRYDYDALSYEPAPLSSFGGGGFSFASSSASSSSSSSSSVSSSSSSSSSSSTVAHDYEYPDMSRYYAGTDYAASLPASSLPAASGYSSGFTSLFASKAQTTSFDDGSGSPGSDPTKYDRRIEANHGKEANARAPFLRRCYQFLATVFVALVVADLAANQQLPDLAVYGGAFGSGGNGNGTVHGWSMGAGGGGVSAGSAARGRPSEPREALDKLMLFGRHGASPGRFDQPKGLVLVRNRFLFVSDFANKRLQVLHFHDDASAIKGQAPGTGARVVATVEEGAELKLAEPVFEYAMEMDQVGGPWALATLDDFIFVAEWGMHRVKILKLDAKTAQLKAEGFFGQFGYVDEPGKFNHPRGVAVHKAFGLLVVSDENDHLQVLRFSTDKKGAAVLSHVSSFGRGSSTAGALSEGGRSSDLGFFRRPSGIAIHAESGLVFVVDSRNHRLQTLRLTPQGELQPISKFGAGGGFRFKTEPSAISLHPTHPLLMVTEAASQCVHEILINPGGHLSLRRSHCGKICSSSVSGSGLRLAGSRAPGPTSVLLVKDLVLVTAGDQVMLLKWKDWVLEA